MAFVQRQSRLLLSKGELLDSDVTVVVRQIIHAPVRGVWGYDTEGEMALVIVRLAVFNLHTAPALEGERPFSC